MAEKKYKKSLFIFRRDLRIEDNTGLLAAAEESESVVACFIVNPQQVGKENLYRSNNALQFIAESLQDLERQIKNIGGVLQIFKGMPEHIIEQLAQQESIDAVFCNKDYTPFSLIRDHHSSQACHRNHIEFHQYADVLLNEPEDILSQGGTPYAVYTAFYKKSLLHPVQKPNPAIPKNLYAQRLNNTLTADELYNELVPTPNEQLYTHGGNSYAKKVLAELVNQIDYLQTRDFPSISTSGLSAHLKFGTVSIRQVYYIIKDLLGANHPLLRQLYWRDFFTHVAYHSPFVFGHAYQQKFDTLPWSHDTEKFERWCTGTTGFPIVDAGMRQLNATGYMHNRVRMIVASFLTKDLRIDWRWGERYFAQKLVDYDPSLNNGNWQWSASTGCDAQPYFRIFNPWLQQKKFDPECMYIKKWIPELKSFNSKIVHSWNTITTTTTSYPRPMVDHTKEAQLTKAWFLRYQSKDHDE